MTVSPVHYVIRGCAGATGERLNDVDRDRKSQKNSDNVDVKRGIYNLYTHIIAVGKCAFT